VGSELIRIFSDVHYADRGSRVRNLEQLRPLLAGASELILNGDSLDTRPSKHPAETESHRAAVKAFFTSAGVPVTFLTGNHDPDMSTHHAVELAGGQVLVTHGDVLFDNIVPWSREAPGIRTKLIAALAALPEGTSARFEERLAAFRQVAGSIPQQHQAERNPLKYAARLAGDTVWPPQRALAIIRAWSEAPGRAAALARRHRPNANFILIGHTHRPGVWRTAAGVVVINTGSFCRPFGAMTAEVAPGRITVRRIEVKKGAFHLGRKVADFPLT
jgi:predicted phosphodiesterase